MSGYIPDIYNDNNRYLRKSMDSQLGKTDEGGFTLHDVIEDWSLNPETLLILKEEALSDDFDEALEIDKYYD